MRSFWSAAPGAVAMQETTLLVSVVRFCLDVIRSNPGSLLDHQTDELKAILEALARKQQGMPTTHEALVVLSLTMN